MILNGLKVDSCQIKCISKSIQCNIKYSITAQNSFPLTQALDYQKYTMLFNNSFWLTPCLTVGPSSGINITLFCHICLIFNYTVLGLAPFLDSLFFTWVVKATGSTKSSVLMGTGLFYSLIRCLRLNKILNVSQKNCREGAILKLFLLVGATFLGNKDCFTARHTAVTYKATAFWSDMVWVYVNARNWMELGFVSWGPKNYQ